MNIEQIKAMQSEYGFTEIQNLIDTGVAWVMEGSIGRQAMDCLKSGACFLPEAAHRDYYGNKVPARQEVQEGSTGSLENSIEFWSNHDNFYFN